MTAREGRTFWLVLSGFLFVCLLFSGAHRLIEQPQETRDEPDTMRVVPAYLCSASSVHTHMDERGNEGQSQSAGREQMALRAAQDRQPVRAQTCADANGNVLRSASYLRTVYQSFDLGDGFV